MAKRSVAKSMRRPSFAAVETNSYTHSISGGMMRIRNKMDTPPAVV